MKNILFIICLGCYTVFAQEYSLSGSFGISTMQLDELSLYQDDLINESLVPAMNLSVFPPYTYYAISAESRITERVRLGLGLRSATTGAHANYTDYSGMLNINQLVNTYLFGISGYYSLFAAGPLEISAMANAGLGITRDLVTKTINTPRLLVEESVRLRSVSPYLLAGFEALYNFNAVSIGLEAGYLANIPVSLEVVEEDNFSGDAIEPSGTLKANSSGWRAGLKIVLPLKPPDPKPEPVQIL